MKESDTLLRRAEKMRRDSLSVRKETLQLALAADRACMMEVAARLDGGARSLEMRACCPLRTFTALLQRLEGGQGTMQIRVADVRPTDVSAR